MSLSAITKSFVDSKAMIAWAEGLLDSVHVSAMRDRQISVSYTQKGKDGTVTVESLSVVCAGIFIGYDAEEDAP